MLVIVSWRFPFSCFAIAIPMLIQFQYTHILTLCTHTLYIIYIHIIIYYYIHIITYIYIHYICVCVCVCVQPNMYDRSPFMIHVMLWCLVFCCVSVVCGVLRGPDWSGQGASIGSCHDHKPTLSRFIYIYLHWPIFTLLNLIYILIVSFDVLHTERNALFNL